MNLFLFVFFARSFNSILSSSISFSHLFPQLHLFPETHSIERRRVGVMRFYPDDGDGL